MKHFYLLISAIFCMFLVQAQTVTLQGNATTSDLTDHSDIAIKIVIEELTTPKETINVVTDASGNYSATFDLTVNPLYPAYGGQYVPATIFVTCTKTGYETTEVAASNLDVPGTFTIDNATLFPTGTTVYTPKICMVNNDTITNYNNIIWDRETGLDIQKYIVYKMINGNWTQYDEILFDDLSVCEDVNTANLNDIYQIQAVFNNGTKSAFSPSQKPPFISMNMDPNTGKPKVTFLDPDVIAQIDTDIIKNVVVFRSKTRSNFKRIMTKSVLEISEEFYQNPTAVATGLLDFIDTSLDENGVYYYRVGLEMYSPCAPAVLKAESGPFSLAMSNIAESESVTTAETAINTIKTAAKITIANKVLTITSNEAVPYQVTTISGQLIENGTVDGKALINLESGLYIIIYGNQSQKILVP